MRNLIYVVLVMFLPLTLASETQHRFKINVEITIEDESTKSVFLSYVNRELRSLGDVDVVGKIDEWMYELAIVAIEPKYVSTGMKTGQITIAWTGYELVSPSLKSDSWIWRPETLSLKYWKTENLDNICKEIVAQFDTKYLEKARKRRLSIKK